MAVDVHQHKVELVTHHLLTIMEDNRGLMSELNKSVLLLCCKKISQWLNQLDIEIKAWEQAIQVSDADHQERLWQEYTNNMKKVDGFYAVKQAALDQLMELEANLETVIQQSSTGTGISKSKESYVRLPRTELDKFDGSIEKFMGFWDFYKNAIHNTSSPKIDKFLTLKGMLSGTAAKAINGLSVSDENYDEAIAILHDRFGRESVVKGALWLKLRDLPLFGVKFPELRDNLDNLESILRQMSVKGEDMNHSSFVHMILPKITYPLQVEIVKYKSVDEEWNLDKLRYALRMIVLLKEEIHRNTSHMQSNTGRNTSRFNQHRLSQYSSVIEQTNAVKVSNKVPKSQKQRPTQEFHNKKFVQVAPSSDTNTNQRKSKQQYSNMVHKKNYPCMFCKNENHRTENCDQYTTWNMRNEKLQELGRCARCFKEGHTSSNCQMPDKACIHCGKLGHNRAMCFKHIASLVSSQPPNINGNQQVHFISYEGGNETVVPKQHSPKLVATSTDVGHQEQLIVAQGSALNFLTNEAFKVNVFLDSGSQKSFISEALLQKLQLPILSDDPLVVYTFAGDKPHHFQSKQAECTLLLQDGSEFSFITNSLQKLTDPLQQPCLSESDLQYLQDWPSTKFASPLSCKRCTVSPDILLGIDCFWDLIETSHKVSLPSGLYLIPSKLGLLVSGHQKLNTEADEDVHSLFVRTEVNQCNSELNLFSEPDTPTSLVPNVQDLWALDAIGVKDSHETVDDVIAMKKFQETLQFNKEEKRYEVQWPMKFDAPDIPNNYGLAKGRFKLLAKRLANDKELKEKYTAIFVEQLKLGIIEQVHHPTNHLTHYLSHHPVLTPGKATTKCRAVFDASAKANKSQRSLNEIIHRGPVLLPELVGLLLRFRLNSVVVLADIEKAFLQIKLQECSRDVTRFLYYADSSNDDIENNIQIYRFTRVAFGIIASPFLLGATIQHHLGLYNTPTASQIAKNIYVDNVIVTFPTVEQAIHFYHVSKNMFNEASFNLRDWNSNIPQFFDEIIESDKPKSDSNVIKVLGIPWDKTTDNIGVSVHTQLQCTSKRDILKYVAGIYDPMGMVAPITLNGKLFLKELWKSNLGWDDQLSEQLLNKWQHISNKFDHIKDLQIPRMVHQETENNINHMVVFVDASKEAYAAVVYLITESYLTQMEHKQLKKTQDIEPELNEVVLIEDNFLPRASWMHGRIIASRDRTADVLLPSGRVITRSLRHLYPFEVRAYHSPDEPNKDTEDKSSSPQETADKPMPSEDEEPTDDNIATNPCLTKLHCSVIHTHFTTLAVVTVLLLAFTNLPFVLGGACAEGERGLQPIDSEKCVHHGLVVYRQLNYNLCYLQHHCPVGHLDGMGHCGKKCPCPTWAEGCSFPDVSPKPSKSEEAILFAEKPNICSFKPDERCNEKASHQLLNQIQLFDGSKHFVNNLQTEQLDGLQSSEEYTCIGSGPQTGSPEFCKTHDCKLEGSKFCYYKRKNQAYYVSPEGKIAIKAWGAVITKFYQGKEILPQTPICHLCHFTCIKGGIKLSLDPNLGQVEVCATPYCYMVSHPKTTEVVMLPSELSLMNHEVNVKVWSNGYLIKHFGKKCPANPFCESIDCWFCFIALYNPQCAPRYFLLSTFLLLYFGAVTTYILCKLAKIFFTGGFYTCLFCSKMCGLCIVWARRLRNKGYQTILLPLVAVVQNPQPEQQSEVQQKPEENLLEVVVAASSGQNKVNARQGISSVSETRQDQNQPSTSRQQKAAQQPRYAINTAKYITLIVFLLSPIISSGCMEVTTLTAQRSICTTDKVGKTVCIFSETTLLTLVPQGLDACLLLEDPNGEPVGTLSITISKIILECQVKSEFFTRSYYMKTQSEKRCPTQGSCDGNKCGDVTTSSKLDELKTANKHYGWTYCQESCGCWACSCFYCTAACLFYRNYALPASDKVYEVFSCPVWEFRVDIVARLTTQTGIQQSKKFVLRPGIAVQWDNLKMTLNSITPPPLPILGSTFITDSTITAMIKTSGSGQAVKGTIGELQCANRQKATKFDCYMSSDPCHCQTQESTVTCQCTAWNIEEVLRKKPELLLPMETNGITVTGHGTEISAQFNGKAALQLQVTLEGFHLITKTTKNKCTITALEFGGCYKCLLGAQLSFECKTDHGEALAHTRCGSVSFSTACTTVGVKAIAHLNFQHAQIKETCQVSCPAGDTTFDIESNLVYVDQEQLGSEINIMATGNGTSKAKVDIGFLGSWFSSSWLVSLAIIFGVGILACITIPLFPVIIRFIINFISSKLEQKLPEQQQSEPTTLKTNKSFAQLSRRNNKTNNTSVQSSNEELQDINTVNDKTFNNNQPFIQSTDQHFNNYQQVNQPTKSNNYQLKNQQIKQPSSYISEHERTNSMGFRPLMSQYKKFN